MNPIETYAIALTPDVLRAIYAKHKTNFSIRLPNINSSYNFTSIEGDDRKLYTSILSNRTELKPIHNLQQGKIKIRSILYKKIKIFKYKDILITRIS